MNECMCRPEDILKKLCSDCVDRIRDGERGNIGKYYIAENGHMGIVSLQVRGNVVEGMKYCYKCNSLQERCTVTLDTGEKIFVCKVCQMRDIQESIIVE